MKKLKASEELLLKDFFEKGVDLMKTSKGTPFGQIIYLIRKKLCMSQRTLSKRSGIPQSQISRIEKDSANPNSTTLEKLCHALFCNLVVFPVPKQDLDSVKEAIAKKIAKKRMGYISGTMSLEKQNPDFQMQNEMLKQEERDLINNLDRKSVV